MWPILCCAASLALVRLSYGATRAYLRRTDARFAGLTDAHQLYCVKNRVKAGVLMVGAPVAVGVLAQRCRLTGYRHVDVLRCVGQLYAATDMTALWVVPRLPTSTLMHHSVVTLLAAANLCWIDYDDWESPFSNVAVLTALACLSFPVNYYLSLRRLRHPTEIRTEARVALLTYAPTFAASLGYHAWVGLRHGRCTAAWLAYGVLVAVIWRDDAVLLRFLLNAC